MILRHIAYHIKIAVQLETFLRFKKILENNLIDIVIYSKIKGVIMAKKTDTEIFLEFCDDFNKMIWGYKKPTRKKKSKKVDKKNVKSKKV